MTAPEKCKIRTLHQSEDLNGHAHFFRTLVVRMLARRDFASRAKRATIHGNGAPFNPTRVVGA
ncbi:hypothetical protein [Paraburkholderia humisilvae]|uniref:Uncharacterized protein n=1 Tax=Paraburkholderia humisilvae TaxID=627669 RepID=A0A6J5CZC9_9BURK|nr:hypothetical protein [Paraburkholderia humisilvae]CAB3747349.1 hypothetical protein LMG29542_00417 [Paraburkholderia humisilvae]